MFRKLFAFLLRFFIRLLVLGIVLLGVFIGLVYIGGFGPIADKKELTEIKQQQASIVYSADHKAIGKYFLTNRTNVSFDKLPKHLINALIATEDSRFYEHKGIDKIAMLRVVLKTIILGNNSAGGGSTLSQQLAKNLYKRKDFAILSMPVNKTKEAILANRLETIYSKNEILALYLNTVPFGENVYGIESAAHRYFSVPVNQLTLEQSAVLIGMLKANTYYNPRKNPENALQRRNVVLHQMLRSNLLSEIQYDKASRKDLSLNYTNLNSKNPNGYFLNQVKNRASKILVDFTKSNGQAWDIETDGLIIETTLVSELQNTALSSRKRQLISLQKSMDHYWSITKNKREIQTLLKSEWERSPRYKELKKSRISNSKLFSKAKEKKKMLVFDWEKQEQQYSSLDSINHYLKMLHAAVYGVSTKTGAVQIYVAGNNYDFLPYDLIHSERQSASTFKPIVFTAALENGQKPCDWISNEQVVYEDYDNWKPENYDHSNGGYYSMLGTLTKSLNIPTVATYFKTGHTKIEKTTNALGLTKTLKNTPATALGSTSYSLQQMVHAYIPFATRKYSVKPYYITSIKTSKGNIIYRHKTSKIKTPISKNTLETMQYLLKNVVDEGTGISLKTKYKARGSWAGKTGTSQNYSDSWFIGFNSDIIIGSWVGCKYPSIHLPSKIGGGSVAALPIVGTIVQKEYTTVSINSKLSAGFPKFSQSILNDCNCEFYRDENTVEKILDIFNPKDKNQKKDNFFNRLFKVFKKK